MSAHLEKEYKIYLTHLDEFVLHHCNKYVLIKDDRVVDFFCSYKQALKAGLKNFGNVPFFVKEIRKKEEASFSSQPTISV